MIKVAWLVRRAPGADRDGFMRRWNGEHAALVAAVPGLERYLHNETVAIAEGPGAWHDEPAIEGVACAWWADRGAFEAALRSPEWRRVLDDGREILDLGWERTWQGVEIEEQVMRLGPATPWAGSGADPSLCKHVGVLYFRPDLTRAQARAHWRDRHGQIALRIPEILHYVQSHGARAVDLDPERGSPSFPFDGFSEAWFADRPTFERAHASPRWLDLQADSPNLFDVDAIEAGVNCVVAERVLRG